MPAPLDFLRGPALNEKESPPPARGDVRLATEMTCRICGNGESNQTYRLRELMFGLDQAFDYFQCSQCQCLQISRVPDDLADYYSKPYYSLAARHQPITRWLLGKRNDYAFTKKGLIGRFLDRRHPNILLAYLATLNLAKDTRILEVGCGIGMNLLTLKRYGFDEILGIDPFIENDTVYPNGLTVLKRSLMELQGEWDLIVFNHSFEHMPNPLEVLESVSGVLSNGGTCLIRIPVVSSFAWEEYGSNWIQLDPPRHLFLHSEKSLRALAEKAGLRISHIRYDSTEFQFLGSEQCRRGIPLRSKRSYLRNPLLSIFSHSDIRSYRERAKALNAAGRGDQAAFELVKHY